MTRSYKHTPIFGIACTKSPKWYKVIRHGQERARVRQALAHGEWERAEVQLAPHNMWFDPRDGQRYDADFYPDCGWGIHNPEREDRWPWTPEVMDEYHEKALRK